MNSRLTLAVLVAAGTLAGTLVLTAASLLPVTAEIAVAQEATSSLVAARKGFVTKLTREERDAEPLEEPHAELFTLVKYPGPAGELSAYVTVEPPQQDEGEAAKHPAIVWVTGGFPPGGIGADAWEPTSLDNEQSARAYRHAGIVMMYPTLRGTFGNPGLQESFFGEVDDVIAAADHLATLPYVDRNRIYLGGHSTGGTLVLLVAAATERFRGVLSFGPVADPLDYSAEMLTYDPTDARENRLRSPIHFLDAIRTPTLVIEGAKSGNAEALASLEAAAGGSNPKLRFASVNGAGHFDVLSPINRMLARRIADGADLDVSAAQIQDAFDAALRQVREADDLETLARLRRGGVDLDAPQSVEHYLLAREKESLQQAAATVKLASLTTAEIERFTDDEGVPYYLLRVRKRVRLSDLDAVFAVSATVSAVQRLYDLNYDGWGLE